MPIFPLSKPLSDRELLKTTCHLYVISLLKVIPFSLICVAITHFVRYGKAYLPHSLQQYHQQASMVLLVLTLPLIGIMITLIDKVATESTLSTMSILKEGASRFLNFMITLISMAFIPLIALSICVMGYLALLNFHVSFKLSFAWIFLSMLIIFAALVPNIFAPWLISSDGLDANDSQETSKLLVKNHFWRTYSHSLFAVLVIVYFLKLPELFHYYFAHLSIDALWVELVADVLLMVIGPWSLVFLLTNKYDQQVRNKDMMIDPDHLARKQKMKSAIPIKKTDNVSF